MGRWMPESSAFSEAYLGEVSWHPAWRADDATATLAPLRLDRFLTDGDSSSSSEGVEHAAAKATEIPLLVAPAFGQFTWDARVQDCSLEADVFVQTPATILLDGTDVVRHPDLPDWYENDQLVVTSRVRNGEELSANALLVRESWLVERLKHLELGLVSALLAERMILDGRPRSWRIVDQAGWLENGQWQFGPLRHELHHRLG